MVTRLILRMGGVATLAPLKDTQLIMPATQDTDCLDFLDEFVSLMECGQDLSHLVKVS